MIMEAAKNMSDREFQNLLKKGFVEIVHSLIALNFYLKSDFNEFYIIDTMIIER
jgi:hypothetical protein